MQRSAVIGFAALALSAAFETQAAERTAPMPSGGALRVIEQGPRNDKPPVVLIAGWGMSAEVWREQTARLAKSRRVIAFDPRGQGRSSGADGVVTPERRAADLQALLAGEAGRVVLVGWSQGVQDIAAYVQDHGTEKVAGVVLVDAPVAAGAAGVTKDPQGAAQQLRLLSIYAQAPQAYARGMVETIVTQPAARTAHGPAMVADILRIPTDAGVAMLVADLLSADRTGALARIDRPTLVIAAAGSPELQDQRDMAAAIPHARLEVIAQAGHAVFIDQPERFAAALARFLDGLG